MAATGVRCVRGEMTFEACTACRAHYEQECGYPYEYLDSLKGPDRDPENPTVTMLLGCERSAVLHEEAPYWKNVEYNYAAWRGTMVHEGIYHTAGAQQEPFVFREIRVSTSIDGMTVTGKPDWFMLDAGRTHLTVRDYKTVSKVTAEPNILHQIQVNCYALLIANDCRLVSSDPYPVVDELEIIYMDSSKSRSFTSRRGEIKIKPYEWTEEFLRKRLTAWHLNKAAPPVLGYSDRWKCKRCDVLTECAVFHGK